MDSWYSHGLMVYPWNHGIDMDSCLRHGLMVYPWTYGKDMDSWYIHRLVVLTTPMVLTQTHGIVSILLNHTHTRGQSVARMWNFF